MTRFLILTLFCASLSGAQTVSEITLTPPRITPMKAGAKEVAGTVALNTGRVTVSVNGTALLPQNVQVDGSFQVTVPELKENQLVVVLFEYQGKDGKWHSASASVVVALAPPPPAPAPAPTIEMLQLIEGDDSIRGVVSGDVDAVSITIKEGTGPAHPNRIVAVLDATYDTAKKTFVANYPQRLAEGQGVFASGFKGGKPVTVPKEAGDPVATAGYDWGRVKAYVSAGSVLARDRQEFGKANTFVALNIDYTWINNRPIKQVTSNPELKGASRNCNDASVYTVRGAPTLSTQIDPQKVEPEMMKISELDHQPASTTEGSGEKRKTATDQRAKAALARRIAVSQRGCRSAHALFNTYFEGQLTQNPASSSPSSATTTGSGTQPTPADPIAAITQSANSANIEAGAYLPVILSQAQWTYHNLDNALYFAPIVKGGVLTIREQTPANPAVPAGVYHFVAGGLRFGHLILKNDPSGAADNLSWIDFTLGRWTNFRVPSRAGSSASYETPLRFDLSGRFQIPKSPFFLSAGVNTGRGADDYRLTVGVRLDLAKFLGTLGPKL